MQVFLFTSLGLGLLNYMTMDQFEVNYDRVKKKKVLAVMNFCCHLMYLYLKQVLQSASGMYRTLNSLAMRLTKKGGFLMTCSCSGAMTQSGMFLRVLQASNLFLFEPSQ